MNIVIFAGGAGTRLWPLSRRNSPKQFGKFKDNSSTLQMAIERVRSFGLENIYISTNEQYRQLVTEQAPELLPDHILTEPARRDLAAAIGLTLMRLKRRGISGTIAMLWSDHFMERSGIFVEALIKAEGLVKDNPRQFVFLAEKPRFANHNLGWIHLGREQSSGRFDFLGWKYRPEARECEKMFESGEWYWNPGYFVFDLDFVLDLYEKFLPEMRVALREMVADEAKLATEYEKLPAMSFDNSIVEKISPEQATVLKVDMGWSDPGTLYALKEALAGSSNDNYAQGVVIAQDAHDCFLVNEEHEKIMSVVGLSGVVVVNTKDALLVCHKDSVPDIKELLKKLEADGLERYL